MIRSLPKVIKATEGEFYTLGEHKTIGFITNSTSEPLVVNAKNGATGEAVKITPASVIKNDETALVVITDRQLAKAGFDRVSVTGAEYVLHMNPRYNP